MNKPTNNDWSAFLPPYDLQYSLANGVDAEDCIEESLRNIIFMITGFYASARALAFVAGVTLQGSDTFEALSAATKKYYGLVPNSLWPTPQGTFTWKQYYQPVPQEILSQYVPISIKIVPVDLSKSPGWTILRFPNGAQHGVAQFNSHQYADSEPNGLVKELTYNGAVVVDSFGIEIDGDLFVKSAGFTSEQFANFSPEVQAAIKQNDIGGHNVIINGQIIKQ